MSITSLCHAKSRMASSRATVSGCALERPCTSTRLRGWRLAFQRRGPARSVLAQLQQFGLLPALDAPGGAGGSSEAASGNAALMPAPRLLVEHGKCQCAGRQALQEAQSSAPSHTDSTGPARKSGLVQCIQCNRCKPGNRWCVHVFCCGDDGDGCPQSSQTLAHQWGGGILSAHDADGLPCKITNGPQQLKCARCARRRCLRRSCGLRRCQLDLGIPRFRNSSHA